MIPPASRCQFRASKVGTLFPSLDEGRIYRVWLCDLGLPVPCSGAGQTGDLRGEKSGMKPATTTAL